MAKQPAWSPERRRAHKLAMEKCSREVWTQEKREAFQEQMEKSWTPARKQALGISMRMSWEVRNKW